jgi:deoxyribodipyrimidine photo-lyase
MNANRILLLEPDLFKQYPVSKKCISFILELAQNIHGIQIFVGSFSDLKNKLGNQPIYFQEHPLNRHYQGIEDLRPWIIPEIKDVQGSFFSFWKKNEKLIRKLFDKN